MKLIPLTKGLFAQVDDEDYDYLMQWKWCATKSGKTFYAQRTNEKRQSVLMHREILSTPKDMLTDHKDHNGLNNQKINLRICNHLENQYNKSSVGVSKYLGVTYEADRKKWRASIAINGKNTKVGRFNTEIEAAKAYNEAALKHRGSFSNLNTIPND